MCRSGLAPAIQSPHEKRRIVLRCPLLRTRSVRPRQGLSGLDLEEFKGSHHSHRHYVPLLSVVEVGPLRNGPRSVS
jgi:hypothetical protein